MNTPEMIVGWIGAAIFAAAMVVSMVAVRRILQARPETGDKKKRWDFALSQMPPEYIDQWLHQHHGIGLKDDDSMEKSPTFLNVGARVAHRPKAGSEIMEVGNS